MCRHLWLLLGQALPGFHPPVSLLVNGIGVEMSWGACLRLRQLQFLTWLFYCNMGILRLTWETQGLGPASTVNCSHRPSGTKRACASNLCPLQTSPESPWRKTKHAANRFGSSLWPTKKTQNLPCWLIASASQERKGKERSLPEFLLCVLCSSLSLSHLIPGQHWKAGIIKAMLQSSWKASEARGI